VSALAVAALTIFVLMGAASAHESETHLPSKLGKSLVPPYLKGCEAVYGVGYVCPEPAPASDGLPATDPVVEIYPLDDENIMVVEPPYNITIIEITPP